MTKRMESMIKKGAREGMKTLLGICAQGDKDADRIAAAKVLLDYGLRREEEGGKAAQRELRVILENVPEQYLT